MNRCWYTLTMVLLLLLAFGMRLYRLADLPPGPYHDEAYNGLDALALLDGRAFPLFHDTWEIYAEEIHARHPAHPTRFPVYFEGNYGREPLYVYLMAIFFRLFGVSDWTLRLISATGGLLAICIVVPLTHTLLADEVRNYRHLTLIAVAVTAGLYPLLTFSRLGLRIVWFVVLEGAAIATFWYAWQTNRRGVWTLAGTMLGLAQYTYGAARFLPLVMLLFVTVQVLRERRLARTHLVGLGLMGLITLLVIAPLLSFFLRYPDFLILRVRAIAVDEPGSGLLAWWPNCLNAIVGLFWRGETDPLRNLPGRPFLDLIQAFFCAVGLVVALCHCHRPAYMLLLMWLAATLAPSIISGFAPHFGRSLGAVLPLVLLITLGIEWSRRRIRTYGRFLIIIIIVLTCSLIFTTYDYFVRYPQTPDLYYEFIAHLADLGRFARTLPSTTTLYLTPPQVYYAGILFELGDESRIQDFYGPAGLLPAGIVGQPTVYLVSAEDTATGPALEQTFPLGRWITRTVDFAAYATPADAVPVPTIPLDAELGGVIRLLGVDLSSFVPGHSLDVRLHWQAIATPPASYTAFLHLIGPDGRLAAQLDRPPGHGTYTTDRWRSGEVILDTYSIPLPAELHPGTYQLLTGFYDASLTRVPAIQDGIEQSERTILLATLEVQ